ncbi:hypothetical protein [Pelagerythrobacter sp.]|uniref:hypothetical protein n=1 Tax=Pelagerythrobacter sp. TaxID=2800702 RepID=UPI0035AE93C3
MRIDAAIEALRGDPTAQRRARRVLEEAAGDWRAADGVAPVLADFDRFGAGTPLGDCRALDAVLTDLEAARGFADGWVAAMLRALARAPLGHVPLRHQMADGHAVLQLAQAGRATLSLVQYSPTREPPPRSVCFADGERREICLSGSAEATVVSIVHEPKDKVELKFMDMPSRQARPSPAMDAARPRS